MTFKNRLKNLFKNYTLDFRNLSIFKVNQETNIFINTNTATQYIRLIHIDKPVMKL